MAQQQTTVPSEAVQSEPEALAQQDQVSQKPDNQAEAIKFIKERLRSSFDEINARQLFDFYTLDKEMQRLQPPDVRKLLLDVLSASEWPLVVPDESLDAVLHELCLNDEGSISWIEFKSFFVFLQDTPLKKLLELITKAFSKEQLSFSRLITIEPASKDKEQEQQKQLRGDEKENLGGEEAESLSQRERNYYDRNKWNQAVQRLVPEATKIFIYFMDGRQILALVVGAFDAALPEPAAAELQLDDVNYLATVRGFNIAQDMFPPITRSGGLKSKVARRIADSYLIARQWDEKHLKLVEKTAQAAHTVSVKWTQFDERFKVNERFNATVTSITNSIKGFDEKHQLTRRLSASAKTFDQKFGITDTLNSLSNKVRSNEKVQSLSKRISQSLLTAAQTVDDINAETQQLVQEKKQQIKGNNADNANQQFESEPAEIQEGGLSQPAPPARPQEDRQDVAPVQVLSQ